MSGRASKMELFGRTRSQTRVLRELHSFPSAVEDYFQPFIKAGVKSNKFVWSSVDKFYNTFQDQLTNCHTLKIFADFVLELLLKFNCKNERLMIRIIFIFWEFFLPKYDEAFSCQDCKMFNCTRRSHFLDTRPLLMKINGLREDYYHIYRFRNSIVHCYQMSIRLRAEYGFLKFMLKYGISYFPNDIEDVHERYAELSWNYYKRRRMEMRFDDEDNNTYLYEFQKILVNPSWRRLLLIIEIVENVFKRDDNKHVSAECFRLYSSSISEPAITVKEVEDFVDLAFADDRAFKIEALSNFKRMFPDIQKLTSPRSLKQLCRIKIRNFLPRSRPHLPSAVAELELLPHYLKNYLLFLCD